MKIEKYNAEFQGKIHLVYSGVLFCDISAVDITAKPTKSKINCEACLHMIKVFGSSQKEN